MMKLWQKHQKFLKGNAGFSLVELIIVIAIMAALVAILAPQFLRYVEKSRKQASVSTASEIVTACKTIAADPDTAGIAFTATWALGTSVAIDPAGDAADAFAEIVTTVPANKSTTIAGIGSLIVTVTAAGAVSVGAGTATNGDTWDSLLNLPKT